MTIHVKIGMDDLSRYTVLERGNTKKRMMMGNTQRVSK